MLRTHRYSAWFLYCLIAVVFLSLVSNYPAAYVRLTYEDMYGEWLQFWLFVTVFFVAGVLTWRSSAYKWFFGLIALAGLYTYMEEISWGQRLFGFESPEFFAANNVQGETNLHNFLTGPESTLLKDIIEYTLATALVGYGLLYPLLLNAGWGVARRLNRLGVAPPPLYLWMFFVNAAFFEIGWFKFNEAEVAEILVGTALVLMLLHYLFTGEVVMETGGIAEPSVATSVRCGRAYLGVFALLVMLAYATTVLFYKLPGRAAHIDARLANGYDKFAHRMEKRERWDDAAELYLRGYELAPQKLPMLHRALASYQAAGDSESYRKYHRIMLDATAKELLTKDVSVENLLMLATSYADAAAETTAQEYLDQALSTAVEWVANSPGNSESRYWLGRAHQQRGEYTEAQFAYRQAQIIEPYRSRYILAQRLLQIEIDKAAAD